MKQYLVQNTRKEISGTINLDGSKSLSNRALIIQALCESPFEINHCSTSDDSQTLKKLLSSKGEILDAHHAGTTFRFMTSYLCLQEGIQTLTGSERMKQRPIGPLVDALRLIGADIKYLENTGYPPLQIGTINKENYNSSITISASISSQFISAILMIAPLLPNGLEVKLEGDLVSRPYLEMTLKMMAYFDVSHVWTENTIVFQSQKYKAKDINIEADWSAASYYYIVAALSEKADITLTGLDEHSLQGDSGIASVMETFGLLTTFDTHLINIKSGGPTKQLLDHDFLQEPDTAQSVAVACAGAGKPGIFSGLKTLKIKETDRIAALEKELLKVGVYFNLLPERFAKKSGIEYYMIEGKAIQQEATPDFDTYKDHRMAMAFAPLGLLFPVIINEPDVVSKSYPSYWKDLKTLGFEVTEL